MYAKRTPVADSPKNQKVKSRRPRGREHFVKGAREDGSRFVYLLFAALFSFASSFYTPFREPARNACSRPISIIYSYDFPSPSLSRSRIIPCSCGCCVSNLLLYARGEGLAESSARHMRRCVRECENKSYCAPSGNILRVRVQRARGESFN